MMSYQFFDVFWISYREVITLARGNKDTLNTFDLTRTTVQFCQRFVIGIEVFANPWVNTGQATTRFFDLVAFTREAVHIGRWPTEIRDIAGKARDIIANRFDFF